MNADPATTQTSSDHIADALATEGWYAGESFFSPTLTAALGHRAEALARAGTLAPARVGRREGAQASAGIRSDETHWLPANAEDAFDPSEAVAIRAVDDFRTTLNRTLFLGAAEVELHFARYAPGARYLTHRDRFRDDDARLVSLVFYLNPAWPADAGGELVLYAADDSGRVITRVSPVAGTLVCFLSDRFPHEVLPATRERYSLTGWLRRTPSAQLG